MKLLRFLFFALVVWDLLFLLVLHLHRVHA